MLEEVTKKVSNVQNSVLSRPFTGSEIEEALKNMNPTKALGPDRVHVMFYHRYWDIFRDYTARICLEILNQGKSMSEINNTIIALIPKIMNPTSMSSFRPISLCNVVYKIVVKSLANRTKRVLKDIISSNQVAFVPKRMILDNVISSAFML